MVERAGLALHLRPDGTVHVPHAPDGVSTLVVADIHLGKAEQFRALGLPMPEAVSRGVGEQTLAVLAEALHATRARRLVVLGDLFHGRAVGETPAALAARLGGLQARPPGAAPPEFVVIGGNHDTRARVDMASVARAGGWRPTLLAEHEAWWLGGCAMTHHPRPVAGASYTLAGHWHPCVTVQAGARDRLRLPCFWMGNAPARPLGVLPAFGAFTGMHPIERDAGDEVFAIADDHVLPV